MVWVKIDDQFSDHPKVMQAGPMASWLYTCGLCYCGRYLTDGFIPAAQVRKLADLDNTDELAARLVDAGLWDRAEHGYMVHDYLEYNPSSSKVLAERQEAKERMRAVRGENGRFTSGESSGEVQPNKTGTPVEVTTAPSPSPSPSSTTPTTPAREASASTHLFALLDNAGVMIGSSMQSDEWIDILTITQDMTLIRDALRDAASLNKVPTAKYVKRTLQRCLAEGCRPGTYAPRPGSPPTVRAPDPPAKPKVRKPINLVSGIDGQVVEAFTYVEDTR